MNRITLYTCASGRRLYEQRLGFVAFELEEGELPEKGDYVFTVDVRDISNKAEDGMYDVKIDSVKFG